VMKVVGTDSMIRLSIQKARDVKSTNDCLEQRAQSKLWNLLYYILHMTDPERWMQRKVSLIMSPRCMINLSHS
jgi:hypothetical protein